MREGNQQFLEFTANFTGDCYPFCMNVNECHATWCVQKIMCYIYEMG